MTLTTPLFSRYSIVYGKNDHKEVRSHRPLPVWLALDQVVDPQNLGAILRSSHFLDVDGVILTEKETAPLSKSVSKASSGALEVMDNLFLTTSLQRFLKNSAECGWMVYGTDLNGESRSAYSLRRDGLRQPSILVLGNEGRGMRSVVSSCCDNHLMIPKMSRGRKDQEYEFVDSLNVSVAAGILLSEMMNSPMNGT